MKRIEKIIALLMLAGTLVFNFDLYKEEPTAKIDPNDNAFQFGLVKRTNEVWDYADKVCGGIAKPICVSGYLTDHWVPNWAQGYNLPYYYSHAPQILIVGSYRYIVQPLSRVFTTDARQPLTLFHYYHLVIYALLSLFPVSVFAALLILRQSWLTAGVGALIASHISTDGLYGIDQASYLWRGWGLSSQLFASVWLPLTLALPIRFLTDHGKSSPGEFTGRLSRRAITKWLAARLDSPFIWSLIILAVTTTGHLGMGMTSFISVAVAAFSPMIKMLIDRQPIKDIRSSAIRATLHTGILAAPPILLLSYWIIPTMTGGIYHNTSVWDPVWKFDSYGVREVLINFGNGVLFDFDRLPVFTALTVVGAFAALSSEITTPLPILFVFWIVMYFGRTTWGGLIDLIPGMTEFHQHRFIVMVHSVGVLLAPIAVTWIAQKLNGAFWLMGKVWSGAKTKKLTRGSITELLTSFGNNGKSAQTEMTEKCIACLLCIPLVALLYPATMRYARWNDVLIRQANTNYAKDSPDFNELVATLRNLPPGRVFAGRGGWWGKSFRIAETPYYMQLSTLGFPTITWLPETWSMNSDTEQFFVEENESHYNLYDIAYVVAPPTQKAQPFWHKLKENPSWILYWVGPETADRKSPDSYGYITGGTSPTIITAGKNSIVNLVHLWIQSDYPKNLLFPEISYRKPAPEDRRPRFTMMDEATYRLDNSTIHSLMGEQPRYIAEKPQITVTDQSSVADMVFRAVVSVPDNCTNCIAVLKQTYHPDWTAEVDGVPVKPFSVFPFFTAVSLENPGTHTVVFRYLPSPAKVAALWIALGSVVLVAGGILRTVYGKKK